MSNHIFKPGDLVRVDMWPGTGLSFFIYTAPYSLAELDLTNSELRSKWFRASFIDNIDPVLHPKVMVGPKDPLLYLGYKYFDQRVIHFAMRTGNHEATKSSFQIIYHIEHSIKTSVFVPWGKGPPKGHLWGIPTLPIV